MPVKGVMVCFLIAKRIGLLPNFATPRPRISCRRLHHWTDGNENRMWSYPHSQRISDLPKTGAYSRNPSMFCRVLLPRPRHHLSGMPRKHPQDLPKLNGRRSSHQESFQDWSSDEKWYVCGSLSFCAYATMVSFRFIPWKPPMTKVMSTET